LKELGLLAEEEQQLSPSIIYVHTVIANSFCACQTKCTFYVEKYTRR